MVFDQLSLLSDAQAITASAPSTNIYDLGAPGIAAYNSVQLKRNLGKGMDTPFCIQVVQDFNLLTSLEVVVQSDDTDSFASPKSIMSVSVPLADLKKGFIFPIDRLPRSIKERFVRLQFNVTGTNPTAGKITAGAVAAVDGSYIG
jgi:hypothetical protein